MTVEPHDLIGVIASHAVALADSTVSSLCALYAAGAPGGVDPGPLAAGAAAGAAAAAAAASSAADGTTGSGAPDGTTGGANVGRNDATRPHVPSSVQARRDAQRAYDQTAAGQVQRQVLHLSEKLQKWAESIVGEDRKGTAPGGSIAAGGFVDVHRGTYEGTGRGPDADADDQ